MPPSASPACVRDIRAFNRFYTRKIGLLRERHLGSPYTLTEIRVLFELVRHRIRTATEIAVELELDAGYLSRILARFARHRLLARTRSAHDGRQLHLSVTEKGRRIFAGLDAKASANIASLIGPLPSADQVALAASLGRAREILSGERSAVLPIKLRGPRPGDFGWVVQRHGDISVETGWGPWFEALVARIVADFAGSFDPRHERCWIADLGGRPCGCIFLVRESDDVAKLRLLLVDAEVRGRGVGRRLIDACIRFARRAGYSRVRLWTNQELRPARHLYEKAGFKLVSSMPEPKFGPGQVAESWELALGGRRPAA